MHTLHFGHHRILSIEAIQPRREFFQIAERRRASTFGSVANFDHFLFSWYAIGAESYGSRGHADPKIRSFAWRGSERGLRCRNPEPSIVHVHGRVLGRWLVGISLGNRVAWGCGRHAAETGGLGDREVVSC